MFSNRESLFNYSVILLRIIKCALWGRSTKNGIRVMSANFACLGKIKQGIFQPGFRGIKNMSEIF